MIRETAYDEIFDAQRHFRTLLDSMSRPGKINRFAPLALTPPEGFPRATTYVAFALLNAELTVKKVDYDYVHDARCSIQSYNRCSCCIC